MKSWYKAVCSEHNEMIDLLVHNFSPDGSAGVFIHEYLKPYEKDIITWLRLHAACDIKLISLDEQLDEAFNDGVEQIDFPG